MLLTCSCVFLRPCVSVHIKTVNGKRGNGSTRKETHENRLGFYSYVSRFYINLTLWSNDSPVFSDRKMSN